ncbi:MAG: tyrosine-type recombinase/integrase [Nodosilinea sp.]
MAKSNRSGQAAIFTPEQLGQVWAELDQPYRLVTQICYFTAARCGEVLSLERSDLQGERIVYRSAKTKTKTTREAMVSQQLRDGLGAVALPSAGYLFPSSAVGGHMTVRAVDKHVRRAAAQVRVDGASTHSFRRSMATHLHTAGVSLRAIQRITGHATLAALERYLDVSGLEAAVQQQKVLNHLFPL